MRSSSPRSQSDKVKEEVSLLHRTSAPPPFQAEIEPSSQIIVNAHGELIEDNKRALIGPLQQALPPSSTQHPPLNRTRTTSPLNVNQTRAESIQRTASPTVKKEEQLPVLIQEEGKDNYISYVSLVKSERQGYSVWSVDAFNLGPEIDVPKKYQSKGWTRRVISAAFGGSVQAVEHHFGSKATKTPFLTAQRSWNYALPHPGKHGIGFLDLRDCRVRPEPIPVFAGYGRNDWRLLGMYEYSRYGEIAPQHVAELPEDVLKEWVKGIVTFKEWGKSCIAEANETIVDEDLKVVQTEQSVEAALRDGRLAIPFTILKCVQFPMEWIRRLEEEEEKQKPNSRKRRPTKQKMNVSKRVKKEEVVKDEEELVKAGLEGEDAGHSEQEANISGLRRSQRKLKMRMHSESDVVKKEDPENKALAESTALLSRNIVDAHGQLTEDEHIVTKEKPPVSLAQETRNSSPLQRVPSPSPSHVAANVGQRSESPPRSTSESSPVVVKKEEQLPVLIKEEGKEDYFSYVSLVKSENGGHDIWSVDAFNLGPDVEVPPKYRTKGWTRKVISDAFGGGLQAVSHHFGEKATKPPFMAVQRSWNHALPPNPGMHGMGFFNLRHCRVRPDPINIFAGYGPNDWRLLGTYEYLRYGEIAPHHAEQLPTTVLNAWVKGVIIHKEWGRACIDNANETIVDEDLKVVQTEASVEAAILDGRMIIPFTILKCVRFPMDWIQRLEEAEANPKPSKSKSKKRKAPNKKRNVSKRVKREEGVKKEEDMVSGSESESHNDHDSDQDADVPERVLRKSPRERQARV
ncbi:hypothetical protein MIND_00449300 [Mycena indigotica]|uniref:DUF6697 domain-containing protein n=1 Tax=Mycena indigotica TaxID=2126181 RepID=A0A8H6SZ67_9AGAR|nr:uncharacterized protein MIND_00449300 [Mycena indigotica]KAF7306580.1 hypothetical protein MIND_00449300 [Mycena indigotica]